MGPLRSHTVPIQGPGCRPGAPGRQCPGRRKEDEVAKDEVPFVPQDLLSGPKSAEAGRAAGLEQRQRGTSAAGATQKPL